MFTMMRYLIILKILKTIRIKRLKMELDLTKNEDKLKYQYRKKRF